MDITGFITIFSLSFLVALSGALSPGPLLVYTIITSVQARKRGYLTGLFVIGGHALLEAAILLVLLFGFSFFLKNTIVVLVVSIIGCLFLIYFGVRIIIDVIRKKIPVDFLEVPEQDKEAEAVRADARRIARNPVIGGIIVSMSNPYWWIWWATIGAAFLVKYEISFTNIPGVVSFFAGHEMGDLVWYLAVSVLVFFGKRFINRKVYYTVLFLLGIFMIAFGLYLAISQFFTGNPA
ncbi:MAG: LysE family transporter [Spirochaetales bacterium]|nr:LysE family transporter [Spirochaetales bacterium]